jgi:hypothetical protein
MPAESTADARLRACFAPRRRRESRQLRFVPGLFAVSTGLSRFRAAADPAPDDAFTVAHDPLRIRLAISAKSGFESRVADSCWFCFRSRSLRSRMGQVG